MKWEVEQYVIWSDKIRKTKLGGADVDIFFVRYNSRMVIVIVWLSICRW